MDFSPENMDKTYDTALVMGKTLKYPVFMPCVYGFFACFYG
jgi:hypothetical protein